MREILISTPFQIYIGSAIVLGLNVLMLGGLTAFNRSQQARGLNAEDVFFNAKMTVGGQDEGVTERYRRAHRNALENVPLFLITGLLFVLTQPSLIAAGVIFGLFTGFRLLHSIAYVKGLQPWRTASFALGALTQIALLGMVGYAVFMG